LGRVVEWSQPRYELDKRFTQLTLLVDQGEEAQQRWEARKRFEDLRNVLNETPDSPALVLLGPPGSGKSTLLRRLEWDLTLDALRHGPEDAGPLTFFIQLNQYKPARPGEELPLPMDWLTERWGRRFPQLPTLDELLNTGRFTLLLDALNEMPHAGHEHIGLWKDFLVELIQRHAGNRVLFSCRSLDYGSSLSSNDGPVPHVRIESLSDAQVQAFLAHYSEHSEALWRGLEGTPQLELYRSPIYLKMLVNQAGSEGDIPQDRAALFTGFVRQALQWEVRAPNPLFQADKRKGGTACANVLDRGSSGAPSLGHVILSALS
jgi:predicted NACHT family NTPase